MFTQCSEMTCDQKTPGGENQITGGEPFDCFGSDTRGLQLPEQLLLPYMLSGFMITVACHLKPFVASTAMHTTAGLKLAVPFYGCMC